MTISPELESIRSSGIGEMIAQRQAIVNQALRNVGGSHGTRGTNPQIHSGAAHGTDPGAGTILTLPTSLPATTSITVTNNGPGDLTVTPGGVTQVPISALYGYKHVNHAGGISDARSVFKPIENTGIKVGEIIAWRMWRIKGDYLESYSAGRIWAPEEHMSGEPSDHGSDGIWAFKEKSRAIGKMLEGYGTVYGSVKLWGKVIEYDFGYRAECAKIISLDDANILDCNLLSPKQKTLRKLRASYGLAA